MNINPKIQRLPKYSIFCLRFYKKANLSWRCLLNDSDVFMDLTLIKLFYKRLRIQKSVRRRSLVVFGCYSVSFFPTIL